MKAIVKNIEVRGSEIKTSAKTGNEYIIVRFEDETGAAQELIDRDMDNAEYYKRGVHGDLLIDIRTGKFTNIEIKNFTVTD